MAQNVPLYKNSFIISRYLGHVKKQQNLKFMEIYSGTGKTKTGELRVSRAIGSLLITSSRKVNELTNERITMYVERANGTNLELVSNVSLKHFILGSTFGQSVIKGDTVNGIGLSALCEIAIDGSITLGANESIKISIDGLVSAQSYSVNGIEYPTAANEAVTLEKKTILGDETEKNYITSEFDLMLLDIENVTSVEMTFSNGVRTKYSLMELQAMSFDVESIITANADGTISLDTGNVLIFPLVEVDVIDIEKTTGTVEITLMAN